jgi:ribosomal protein S18 acetylase RimI-like enzyme
METSIQIRHLAPSDFEVISPVVDEWWGGRQVGQSLPRLFFEHFAPTSFALVHGSEVRAFLVGFRSQSNPGVAYIHFVGVAPAYRRGGYGRILYTHFFECATSLGCTEVQCITSPINVGSIAFHKRMGFRIISVGGEQNGVPVCLDYAGKGKHRVRFSRLLAPGNDGT